MAVTVDAREAHGSSNLGHLPAESTISDSTAANPTSKLPSKWPVAMDLAGSDSPCRLECELEDLVVLGSMPTDIDGTFYRVM